MNSSESDLSWPTTTSHHTSVFCCLPWRRAPKRTNTKLPVKPSKRDNNHSSNPANNADFITLFKPNIPMTPNLARTQSDYVVDGFFFESVRRSAYVTVRDAKPLIPFTAELNDGFVPSGKNKRLMYLGFRYPDGTSLSFVPIRDVILQHRSTAMPASASSSSDKAVRRLNTVYGKDYVYLSIPRVVYYALVQMAEDVFKTKDGHLKSKLPDAEVRGERVWLFNTEMKESCKVEGISDGRRYAKTVTQAMKEICGNLEGDALLYMRFCEDLNGGDPEMKLQFRLHRMLVREFRDFSWPASSPIMCYLP